MTRIDTLYPVAWVLATYGARRPQCPTCGRPGYSFGDCRGCEPQPDPDVWPVGTTHVWRCPICGVGLCADRAPGDRLCGSCAPLYLEEVRPETPAQAARMRARRRRTGPVQGCLL